MRHTLLVLLLLAGALGASAATVFNVSIDTASLAGTSGNLNFQVEAPAGADPLSIALSDFNFDGALDPLDSDLCFGDTPCPISGQIGVDPTVSFGNDPGQPPVFIDYLQPVVFGNLLSFRLVFAGMALDNPTSPSPGATEFRVLLLDTAFQPLLSSDPANGSIVSFLTDDGRVTAENFSAAGEADVSDVPEPGGAALVLLGFGLLLVKGRAFRLKQIA
ncbi:MAG: NF038129 family PEP-CTERM protein [Bryobacterales bacterium]|nr:NF038129 family PEP-CTERM protein [Bryobacterales bacterium]